MGAYRRVGAMLVAAIALSGCAKQEPPAPVVRPVQLAHVVIGGVADIAVFAGDVRPRHETDLGFRIAGKIVERQVDVGTVVKKGQPLAKLDPADVRLQAQAGEAAVAAARTEETFSRAELARFDNLYRQKFVSESALDQKRNAHSAAAARLTQAQANLSVSRNQAGYATLVAPDDGVITTLNAEPGQVVAAGQPVMRLARTGEREAAIAVPENRIGELQRAQRLSVVLLANPQHAYSGRVREISPAVDPVSRTFAVRVTVLDGDAALGWGMTVNVVAMSPGTPNDALIPLTSIYHQTDGKPAVWIYDPATQKVALREVALGAFREDGVLVTRGLANGEWVVAAGVNKLQQGQSVKPYEQPGKSSPSSVASTIAPTAAVPPAKR